jgi:serine/threonine-protein kinase
MTSEREPEEKPPERLAHFRIVERLGSGGMGVVYRAEDEKLRRMVAVKLLPAAFAQDEERRRRFLREARSAAALSHANIATVFEVSEDHGRVFLVMELIEGKSLRDRIAGGRLPVDEAVHLARGVARGLVRAHAKGIVHRDIKPENVMLDADGEPKILDFGLAKLREEESPAPKGAAQSAETETVLTEAGRSLGTPQYMSPEQARGDAVDSRTDLYSLGVMLYEMLGGRRPFSGSSTADFLAAVLRDAPPPLGEIAPGTPPALVEIVHKCLARAPADRWPGARELLDALDAFGASQAASTTQLAVAAGGRARAGKIVAVIAGAGALAVLALIARPRFTAHSAPGATESSRPRGITDWPPPKTSSPEAAALYAEALQALRDGLGDEDDLFKRAVAIDPHFAAANLRLGVKVGTLKDGRESLARAAQSRALLDARDQRLLSFAQAWRNADPPRVLTLAQDFARDAAGDAEMQMWASQALMEVGATAEAARAIDRVLELEPRSPFALSRRSFVIWLKGDADGVLRSAEDCLAGAPTAVNCLVWRAEVHNVKGQCDKLESDGRRLVALKPSARAYWALGLALDAQGASQATLEQLDRSVDALQAGAPAARLVLQEAARLAARSGDFVAAEKSLQSLDRELSQDPDEWAHATTADLLALYSEEGETAKATAVAEDFLRKLPTMIHGSPVIYDFVYDTPLARLMALAALRRAGRMSAAEAQSLRDSWQREWLGDALPVVKGHAWTWLYAYPAETAGDAREALAVLDRYAPLPPDDTQPRHAGARGKVYALAGNADAAIPLLRAEVGSCGEGRVSRLPGQMWWQASRMRNRLLLGGQLEQKGDRAGACEQYAAILARWGNAKPRSLTAEAARARATALTCPPAG